MFQQAAGTSAATGLPAAAAGAGIAFGSAAAAADAGASKPLFGKAAQQQQQQQQPAQGFGAAGETQ